MKFTTKTMGVLSAILFSTILLANCGSEESDSCFQQDRIGSCKYLCEKGNEEACLEEAELGQSQCFENGDPAACNLVCQTQNLSGAHPEAEPYCEKHRELCKLEKNKDSFDCEMIDS